MDAGTEQPILEQVRTKGMLDHTDVISSNGAKSVGDTRSVEAQLGGENGPERDVLRGGRRVAPVVSTEYPTNVPGLERSRKGGSPGPGRKSDRKAGG
jgi:hypothetical protein